MIDIIRSAWSWTGLEPVEVVAQNEFGNLIVRASDDAYWRICPEEWSCEQIAPNTHEFGALSASEDFQVDWEMTRLVELARKKLGTPLEGSCYCLKMPGIIGGKYEGDNLGLITLDELISFSGDMAYQLRNVPDGEQIKIKIVNPAKDGQ